jgi:hypothetical protein
LAISCEILVWANSLSGIAAAETMAPAIIGTLFNRDRRQTPSFVAQGSSVMEPSLHCAQTKRNRGRKPIAAGKVPGIRNKWTEIILAAWWGG